MDPILMLLDEYRLGLSLKTSKYLKYLREEVGSVDLSGFVAELKHLRVTEQGPVEEATVLIDTFEEFFRQIDALIECEEPSFDDKVKCHIQLVVLEAVLEQAGITSTGEPGVVH